MATIPNSLPANSGETGQKQSAGISGSSNKGAIGAFHATPDTSYLKEDRNLATIYGYHSPK